MTPKKINVRLSENLNENGIWGICFSCNQRYDNYCYLNVSPNLPCLDVLGIGGFWAYKGSFLSCQKFLKDYKHFYALYEKTKNAELKGSKD